MLFLVIDAPVLTEHDRWEDALVLHAQRGDESAFRELVDCYALRIHRTIFRFNGNPDDAEDLFQESIIALYTALPRFQRKSSFYTFLFSIVANTCKKAYHTAEKEHARMTELIDPSSRAGASLGTSVTCESAEESLLRRERQQAIHDAILKISEPFRMVYILAEVEGYSEKEIAAIIHKPVGTVKSRLNRARRQFQQHMLACRELFQG